MQIFLRTKIRKIQGGHVNFLKYRDDVYSVLKFPRNKLQNTEKS